MAMTVSVTTSGPPKLKKRDQNNAVKLGMWDVAAEWHGKYRPIHFTARGARRYNMAPRHTKRIRGGEVRRTRSGRPRSPDARPLYWSGRSFMLSRVAKIKATNKRSRVTSPIRAFNFPIRKNPRINMRREYSEVVNSEIRGLEKVAGRTATKELSRPKTKVTVRF